ncbi:MAG: 50S ribosomal protein L30e [Candidatus Hydrothermarchaeales archaeon]
MNIERAIRTVVDTGEVILGAKESIASVMDKKARLVLVAENCPKDLKDDLDHYANISNIYVYNFPRSSMEMGAVCGKPYVISMLSIIEVGDSDILELKRRK